MKKCPYCAEEIQDEAIKCRFCGSMLADPELPGAPVPTGDEALQFTHSGRRYLLGYGRDFFGIWDRQGGQAPLSRYPRTDDGWRQAWLAFVADEPESSEVGIGAAATPTTAPGSFGSPAAFGSSAGTGASPFAPRRISGAWWLLPIFMGWLGGLIAWLLLREQDAKKARAMLITGIAVSALLVVLVVSQQPA